MIPTVLWLLLDFLSLKNDADPDPNPDPDPDPPDLYVFGLH